VKRRKVMRAFESKFNRLLFDARAEVLAKINDAPDWMFGQSKARAGVAADLMFNLVAWGGRLVAEMRKVSLVGLTTAGEQLMEELERDDPFSMPEPRAIAFLKERENKMHKVKQEVFDKILSSIEDSMKAGDSRDEMAKAIRTAANEITEGRSKLVAQTETAVAYGVGRHEAMKQAGVMFKGWLSSRNRSVRDSHIKADHKYMKDPIPLDVPFIVGGSTLMHPGDPDGPAREVCNCHCVQVAIPPEEALK